MIEKMKIGEIKDRCKDILRKSYIGQLISGEDKTFLLEWLSNHQDWTAKKGVGVENIYVGKSGNHGSKCFFLYRSDGTTTDISYNIKKTINKKEIVTKACRSAIEPEREKEREKTEWGVARCPFNGEVLYSDTTVIHHYNKEFAQVVNTWLTGEDIDLLYSKVNATTDMDTKTYFTDPEIINNFTNFHNNNTHLIAVSKTWHDKQ